MLCTSNLVTWFCLYVGQLEESEEDGTSDGNVMPTGRVVGILQRNWREYVASFASDEVLPYHMTVYQET